MAATPEPQPQDVSQAEVEAGLSDEVASRQKRTEALASLQQQGVNLVISGESGTAATIGSQCVHVGDLINGYEVLSIGPDGVILSDPAAK